MTGRWSGELLAVRKNLGLMMPGTPAGRDGRRAATTPSTPGPSTRPTWPGAARCTRHSPSAGFRVDHSEASLYLWATRGEDCWETVSWLAERGILVAPGEFYGAAGAQHVRVALTATDERVAAAVERLRG